MRWLGGGFVLALVISTLVSVSAHYLLTSERHIALTKEALSSDVFQSRPGVFEEMFGECGMLMMQWLRQPDLEHDAVESMWVRPGPENLHPCQMMSILLGLQPSSVKFAEPTLYPNYPFGPRYLLALAEVVIGKIQNIRLTYEIVSYVAVVSLLVAAAISVPSMAWAMVPIVAVLAFGFAQNGYAHNLVAAPVFATIFFVLALMVAANEFFAPLYRRAGLMVFLGAIDHYLDLSFSMAFAISLALVVNHLFFVRVRNGTAGNAAKEGLAIISSFTAGYVLSFLLHMHLMRILHGLPTEFFLASIGNRMAETANGTPVTRLDVIAILYQFLYQLTNGIGTSIALGVMSIAAWIVAAVVSIRKGLPELFVDLAVLAVGAGGILVWYAMMVNHTVIHAMFMVRMLALPIAYGFVALVLAAGANPSSTA